MKLKQPLNFGLWDFYIGEESESDSQLLRIPNEGYASSKRQLINLVISTFSSLSIQGKPEYLKAATDEASLMRMPLPVYIGVAIEHQICLRHGGIERGLCFPSGIGDKLHSFAHKLDKKIDKAPKFIQKIAGKVIGVMTGQRDLSDGEAGRHEAPKATNAGTSKSKIVEGKLVRTGVRPRLGGCGSCGGRKAFSNKGKNLGRAGRMQ